MAEKQKEPIDNQQRYSVDFLVAEYQRLIDQFWHNEEFGERRVNFFITLTTAVIGALAIMGKVVGARVYPIFFFGLGALLLFGVVTLKRIIRRNLVSDEYIRVAARIKRYFTERDPQILPYLYYKPYPDYKKLRKKDWKDVIFLGTGGLAETVILINSLIVAAFFALFLLSCAVWITVLLTSLSFVAALVVQGWCVKYRYDRERKKVEKEND